MCNFSRRSIINIRWHILRLFFKIYICRSYFELSSIAGIRSHMSRLNCNRQGCRPCSPSSCCSCIPSKTRCREGIHGWLCLSRSYFCRNRRRINFASNICSCRSLKREFNCNHRCCRWNRKSNLCRDMGRLKLKILKKRWQRFEEFKK
jgi:hypothetical protein